MNRNLLISIVTYNNDPNLLKTLCNKLNKDFIISIFDNSSDEIIKKEISALDELQNVQYRTTHKNIGFGSAHNKNIFDCNIDFEYVLILNPDMEITSLQVKKLLVSIISNKSDKVTLISPLLLNNDGSLQKFIRELPSFFTFLKKIFSINQLCYEKYLSFVTNVPVVHGACLLISKYDFQKIEGFSNDYFLYWEDIDLCRKVHYFKGNVLVDSSIRCIHLLNRESHRSLFLAFIHMKSIISYFMKWGFFQNKKTKKINNKLQNIVNNKM